MKTTSNRELYRRLPSVDDLLREPEVARLVEQEGHAAVAEAARGALTRLREEISSGNLDSTGVNLALSGLSEAVGRQLRVNLSYSLRPVINATGVILHTNMGRAPLASTALEHVREIAGAYSNLELNVAAGERGKRDVHVDHLFRKLLAGRIAGSIHGSARRARRGERGEPHDISTIVVNNNAAAVLLALNTLAEGGEVIVSRGELVEIGGSFRIPEVMTKSGATLREVGTTNRTRLSDYEKAINPRTRALLRVHRSNFQITGFVSQPALEELVAVSRKHSIPLIEDLGSGALFDLESVGIGGEPGVVASLNAGVDVVCYSGDKLLGGPQAGMVSGRRDLVARMRSNSLFRALRVDKLTYAALEATLLAYVKQDHDSIPTLRMLRLSKEQIGRRIEAVVARLQWRALSTEIVDGESVVGGGAAPSAVLPTRLLAITVNDLSADELAARLRASDYPIIARVEEGRVLLDLRTVFPEQDEMVAEALASLAASH